MADGDITATMDTITIIITAAIMDMTHRVIVMKAGRRRRTTTLADEIQVTGRRLPAADEARVPQPYAAAPLPTVAGTQVRAKTPADFAVREEVLRP